METPNYYEIRTMWEKAQEQLAHYKAEEMRLRKMLVAGAFPKPMEGTNKVKLSDGSTMRLTYKLDRKVDIATYLQARSLLDEDTFNLIFKHDPTLVLKEYRRLSTEQARIVDTHLIIKPAALTLEVIYGS